MEKKSLGRFEEVESLLPEIFKLAEEYEDIRFEIARYYSTRQCACGTNIWDMKSKCRERLEKIMGLAKGIDVKLNDYGKIEEIRFGSQDGLFSVCPFYRDSKGIPIYLVSQTSRRKLGPLAFLGQEKYFTVKHINVS